MVYFTGDGIRFTGAAISSWLLAATLGVIGFA
jgi:hypothetical protein